MKVVVTGGDGQLATAIKSSWKSEVILLNKSKLDLSDSNSIKEALDFYRPDVVINAGAYTNVDLCESQLSLAYEINGTAVGNLARSCNLFDSLLVQISTDYVFEGNSDIPYKESDLTNPKTVYGASKLEGERQAKYALKRLIVRTSWLYDAFGKNFLKTMLKLGKQGKSIKVVNDQHGTPTSCRVLARQLEVMINNELTGLFHVTCQGETTWYEFAKEIFNQKDLDIDLSPCKTSEYICKASRPAYSVLDNGLIGNVTLDWKLALAEVMKEIY